MLNRLRKTMQFSHRHIILLIGMGGTIISFLWFGLDRDIYTLLILFGVLTSLIAFLIILFKDSLRSKAGWIVVLLLFVALQRITEHILIKTSFALYIQRHERALNEIVQIAVLEQKNMILSSANDWSNDDLTSTELSNIKDNVRSTGTSLIVKDSSKIFFRTFGMLDISGGIYYWYGKGKPDQQLQHCKGHWYF